MRSTLVFWQWIERVVCWFAEHVNTVIGTICSERDMPAAIFGGRSYSLFFSPQTHFCTAKQVIIFHSANSFTRKLAFDYWNPKGNSIGSTRILFHAVDLFCTEELVLFIAVYCSIAIGLNQQQNQNPIRSIILKYSVESECISSSAVNTSDQRIVFATWLSMAGGLNSRYRWRGEFFSSFALTINNARNWIQWEKLFLRWKPHSMCGTLRSA